MEEENNIEAVLSALKKRLSNLLQNRLKHLVLFGSRARGDYDDSSDIDVAVIVAKLDRNLKMRILEEVAEVELAYLQPLSTLVLSEKMYQKLLDRERRIALDIKNEGVAL